MIHGDIRAAILNFHILYWQNLIFFQNGQTGTSEFDTKKYVRKN
jgi:hypothetical protein